MKQSDLQLSLRTGAALACGLLLTALTSAPARAIEPSAIELPELGEPADNSLSPAQEKALGSRVMSELFRSGYILEDRELTDYISALGWTIAGHSQTPPPPLTFFIVADSRINAFAMPGGFIGFNAGLLLAADDESEVAAVMGHELAHVTQRHIARSVNDSEVANVATWLAVIAAIIAGSADPDVVIGALSLGQSLSYYRQVSYTRAHEEEADRIGIQTMSAAGFDPMATARFFQKLSQQSRLYGSGLPEILRTHPLNTNRIAEARARAAEMPMPRPRDGIDFDLMRARARVLEADTASEAVSYFARQVASHPDAAANRYGLAFAQARAGQNAAALATLEPVRKRYPQQFNIQLLHAQLLFHSGERSRGLRASEKLLNSHPRQSSAILSHAELLLDAGQPEAAREVLLTHDQAFGIQPETYKLLAQAARAQQQIPEAAYQMASYLQLRGDYGNALAQIDAGLRQPRLDDTERARLVAKRSEIRRQLPDNWRPQNGRRATIAGTNS